MRHSNLIVKNTKVLVGPGCICQIRLCDRATACDRVTACVAGKMVTSLEENKFKNTLKYISRFLHQHKNPAPLQASVFFLYEATGQNSILYKNCKISQNSVRK